MNGSLGRNSIVFSAREQAPMLWFYFYYYIFMKILVLNSGSSSLKYQLFDMPSGDVICKGNVENI